jgi:hypothetical protein
VGGYRYVPTSIFKYHKRICPVRDRIVRGRPVQGTALHRRIAFIY